MDRITSKIQVIVPKGMLEQIMVEEALVGEDISQLIRRKLGERVDLGMKSLKVP